MLVVSACLGASPAIAVDGTWTGTANSDWNTDANWSPGPTPTNTASFANNGAPTSVSIGNLTSINTIQFVAGAPVYSFTFVTSPNQTFNINGAGIINNSSSAPIFGQGPIFFNNSSTAGNAIFSAGINFNDTSTAGNATINNINGNGSGLDFNNSSTAGNSIITTNNQSQTSFGGNSTGGNASITTNLGGRTLFADFSTAGSANIVTKNGGRTDFFTRATGGLASFVTEAGGIVDFSGTLGPNNSHQISAGSISGAGTYFLGRNALTVGGNNLSTSVSGVISDCGTGGQCNSVGPTGSALVKVGTGTMTLAGANAYSGGTTVNAGTLALSGSGTLGSSTNSTTVNGTGAILDLGGTTQIQNGGVTLVEGTIQNGTLTSSGGFNVQSGTASATLAGSGTLTKSASGLVTLSGANTYTGGTTVDAGTLQLSGSGTLGNTANSTTVNGTSAILDLGGTTQTQNGGVTLVAGTIQNGTLSSSGGFDVRSGTVSATLAGSGALTKSDSGTVVLSGPNTYTGGTIVNAGTLEMAHTTATNIDSLGSGAVVLNGGTLRSTVSGQFANNTSFASGATGTFSVATGRTVTTTGFLTFSDTSVARFGSATDTGTVVIGSPGGIFISPSSNLEVNGGTLRAASGATFLSSLTGANASTTVAAGATLDFNDQMAPTFGGINDLLGAGRVVIGTNAATDLKIAKGFFDGEISGAGSLHLANYVFSAVDGTLVLTGTNTYIGGTILDANHTLQLGNGGATGSISGAVLNNGTLTFNRSNTYVYDGPISGNGALQQIGNGNTILTAANTYTGTTTVNAGILSVNGSIATSSLTTVNAAGTLGGDGTVGNTLINGGTLAPGNSIGVLTVQGNLVFAAASSYMVQVSPTNADRTNVTGTVTLGGAVVNASFAPGKYIARQYTILSATGGISGTFGSPANTNLPANFTSSLSYDAGNVYLDLGLAFAPSTGLNGNQRNVANALTYYFNATGGIPMAFGALRPAGLSEVAGETATGSQQTTFGAMSQFITMLLDPFVDGRGSTPATGSSITAFADADSTSAYAAGRKRSAAERDAHSMITKAPPRNDLLDPRWSVWAAGFGGAQTTDGNLTLGSNTVTSRVVGTAVGADYLLSPRTIAGFAMAGGGTNFSIANGYGSGRSDLFQAGAFVRHRVGEAYISSALAYGWQNVTTDRTVAGIDRLRANFNANAFSGRAEGGYRFVTPWMRVGLTPYAAGQFTTFDLPAYAEQVLSGANTFALAYSSKSVTSSRSELGLRSDKSFGIRDAVLTLRGRVAWAHDYNIDRNVGATFQTLPGATFIVNGAAQTHDAALTTASAEMRWRNGWSAGASFEGEFSNVAQSYAGKGVARYSW